MTPAERLAAAGPKKILACDGGGIRGLMSVEILAELEAILRQRTGKPDLVLGDWFDFVTGTSTGAIIATCIACGMSMDSVRRFYVASGPQMFERASILKRLQYKFDDEPLAHLLRDALGQALGGKPSDPSVLLGDERLRTLLMVVARNHTTDSPWPVSNNPKARYNDRARPDCNLLLPLWQLVRASTAAPTFFPPEVVSFQGKDGKPYSFVFVDGGVTAYNNPAFLAFLMATAKPYAMNWRTGESDMLLVSVGTGSAPRARPSLQAGDLWLLDHARNIPAALMSAASAGWDMTCRVLGDCRFGGAIDREFGDGITAPAGEPQWQRPNWSGPKQFTYLRYDPDVTREGLAALGLADIAPEAVQAMDSVENIPAMQRVGAAFAKRFVRAEHVGGFA